MTHRNIITQPAFKSRYRLFRRTLFGRRSYTHRRNKTANVRNRAKPTSACKTSRHKRITHKQAFVGQTSAHTETRSHNIPKTKHISSHGTRRIIRIVGYALDTSARQKQINLALRSAYYVYLQWVRLLSAPRTGLWPTFAIGSPANISYICT